MIPAFSREAALVLHSPYFRQFPDDLEGDQLVGFLKQRYKERLLLEEDIGRADDYEDLQYQKLYNHARASLDYEEEIDEQQPVKYGFKEQDHPRAKSGEHGGEFVKGSGGGGGGSSSESKGSETKGVGTPKKKQTQLKPEPSLTLKDLHDRIGKPDGGFTYQPKSELQPKEGFAVSPYPERSFGKKATEISEEDIAEYVLDNEDLWDDPEHFIGAWHDPESGMIFLDVSVVSKDEQAASKLALAKDQIAYFDLQKGKSITVNKNATSGGANK